MSYSLGMSRIAYIFFGTPLNPARVNGRTRRQFMKALNEVVDQGYKKLVVSITSEGGFCEDGFIMYHALRHAAELLELQTHALSDCSSMAGVMLMAGDKRTYAPATTVALHAASNSGKVDYTYTGQIRQVYADRAGWDQCTCDDYFTATKLMMPTPSDLVDFKVFTHGTPVHISPILSTYTIN